MTTQFACVTSHAASGAVEVAIDVRASFGCPLVQSLTAGHLACETGPFILARARIGGGLMKKFAVLLGFVLAVAGCGSTDGDSGGSGGTAGAGGSGGVADLCMGVDCSDGNDCTADVCDSADGSCSNPGETDGTVCDLDSVDDGFCDGAGTCVECNVDTDCTDDLNECTSAPLCTANVCVAQTPLPDTTLCDSGSGTCDGSGTCVSS